MTYVEVFALSSMVKKLNLVGQLRHMKMSFRVKLLCMFVTISLHI